MPQKFKPIKFPLDESAHNDIVEWWYFNGRLKDKQGNEYSFMDCLFRVDVKRVNIPFLISPFKISYFSHSLISDLKTKKFKHRISPFSIVSDDSFSKPNLYINYINPTVKKSYINCVIEKTADKNYHLKNEDIDLNLVSTKKPLLEGGKGFFSFLSKSTYYYSLTNLKTIGRIKVNHKWLEVSGKSWMDHQWADARYSKDKWDWFSIQLDNNTELVCFALDVKGKRFYSIDILYPNNKQEHFKNVEIIPSHKVWKSPKSQAVYPLAWEINIPEKKISLNLVTKIKNQEMLFGSINYWEGPLAVTGNFGNKKVVGNGFMELVGYPSKYTNAKYIKDEIKSTADQFFSMAKSRFKNR